MRAGRLDRRIDIQRNTLTVSDSGEPVEAWADVVSNRPASYRPLKGDERVGTPQTVSADQVEFTVRYAYVLLDLNPKDRIIYPSRTADSPSAPVDETHVYDVIAVTELGRREGIQIVAARRPDLQT